MVLRQSPVARLPVMEEILDDVKGMLHPCPYGATRDRLNLGLASARVVPLPPLNEQAEIVAALNRDTARIDLLTEKTQRSIDLLKERRAAFITAAVTGQIDLREAA